MPAPGPAAHALVSSASAGVRAGASRYPRLSATRKASCNDSASRTPVNLSHAAAWGEFVSSLK